MKTGMEKAGDVGSAETTPETPRNAAPEQPLSLGRVVLYGLRELESYDAAGEKVRRLVERPALVVAVWGAECGNLDVRLDGTNDDRTGYPDNDNRASREEG